MTLDEIIAACIEYGIVLARRPDGVFAWVVMWDDQPPAETFRQVEAHAAEILASDRYVAWLARVPEGFEFSFGLEMPRPSVDVTEDAEYGVYFGCGDTDSGP